MSATHTVGLDWTGGDPELIALALSTRPRINEPVVWGSFDNGVVVWGTAGPPVVLSPYQAVAWPYFDGTVTAGDLAADLADSSDMPLDGARAEIAALVVRAFSVDWSSGVDALAGWFAAQDDPPVRPEANRTWVEEVGGQRWCVMEVTANMGQAEDVIDGRTSVAELWPPDSCGGRAMHIDRPAHRITLSLPGTSLAVRAADPALVAWVDALPQRRDDHAPVHVFVAASSPDGGRRTRYRLFNGLGHLVAAPVGLDEAKRAVASMVMERAALGGAPPDGWSVGARSITDGERSVLATAASIDGGSHLLHHLRRNGAAMDATASVVLDHDGRGLRVPDPERAIELLESGGLADPWASDLWIHRPVSHVFLPVGVSSRPPAERALEVLRDTSARDGRYQREGLLTAVAGLLAGVPVSEQATNDQSPLVTARQLRRLLD